MVTYLTLYCTNSSLYSFSEHNRESYHLLTHSRDARRNFFDDLFLN